MKLLFCLECNDVRALDVGKTVTCRCGKSRGKYLADRITAEFSGDDAYLLGFNNQSLANAMRSHVYDGDAPDGLGRRFEAFVIPEGASTVIRKRD